MIGIHKHSCCYYESEKRGHELIVFGGSTSSQEEKLINDIFIFNFGFFLQSNFFFQPFHKILIYYFP